MFYVNQPIRLTLVLTSCTRSRDTLSSATEISDDEVLTTDGGWPRTFTAGSVFTNQQQMTGKIKSNAVEVFIF